MTKRDEVGRERRKWARSTVQCTYTRTKKVEEKKRKNTQEKEKDDNGPKRMKKKEERRIYFLPQEGQERANKKGHQMTNMSRFFRKKGRERTISNFLYQLLT